MQAPKFKVGEVVILQSKDRPMLNSEYIVAAISENHKPFVDPYSGLKFTADWTHSNFAYILEGCQLRASGNARYWAEWALRKKHLPGEMSYDTLMSSLKLGQPVRV